MGNETKSRGLRGANVLQEIPPRGEDAERKAEGALKLRGKRSPEVGQGAREQGAEGAERRCREGRGLREA